MKWLCVHALVFLTRNFYYQCVQVCTTFYRKLSFFVQILAKVMLVTKFSRDNCPYKVYVCFTSDYNIRYCMSFMSNANQLNVLVNWWTLAIDDVCSDIKKRASAAVHLVASVKCIKSENLLITEILADVRCDTKKTSIRRRSLDFGEITGSVEIAPVPKSSEKRKYSRRKWHMSFANLESIRFGIVKM